MPDTPYLLKSVHEEFALRMEEEHKRQNKRLTDLETTVKNIGSLTASVARLAESMEQLTQIQEKQNKRLEELEGRDGEMWRKVVGYAATFIVGAILSFIFARLGL